MSRESNKEIDILLRKLSGKQNGSAAAGTSSAAGADDHLDADELNAYAEQSLPAAARARYMAHLADCGRCRNLVSQLSLSSTVAVSAAAEEKAPSKLKMFLASLFSPLVMRYAVPAMAVLIVVAIGWIVVNRSPMAERVASNVGSKPPEISDLNQKALPAEASKAATSESVANQESRQRSEVKDQQNKQPVENKQGTLAGEQEPAAPAPKPTPATEIAQSTDDLSKRPQKSAPVAPPAVGTASVAGAKPATDAEKNEAARQKKDEVAAARDVKEKEEDRPAFQKAPETAGSGPSKTQGEATRLDIAKLRAARREAPPREGQREEAIETRSVAGHRFERRGQVWVDVLYESQSTINVARDSEQYRALIGDEPGIRTIAEQLSGEVIVVWKGRAYRIR